VGRKLLALGIVLAVIVIGYLLFYYFNRLTLLPAYSSLI